MDDNKVMVEKDNSTHATISSAVNSLIRPKLWMLPIFLVLMLSFASTSVPSVTGAARVGKIILNPTHATPGTLVTFQGEGWDLIPGRESTVFVKTTCVVSGGAVKVDRHCICDVKSVSGRFEPVGTFIVADVPPGTYVTYVTVRFPADRAGWLEFEGQEEFTVDSAAATTTVVTTATATLETSSGVTDSLTKTETSPVATTAPVTVTLPTTQVVTIQAEEPLNQGLLLIAIVAVIGLVVVSLTIMRKTSERKA